MNEKLEQENKNEPVVKETRFYTLKLLAITVLAFVAALLLRQSMGVIAMFPISLVICFASAVVDISVITKAAIFGVSVFALNSIENKNTEIAVIFSALCILAVLLAHYSFYKIKAVKKIGIPIASASAMVCILLSVIFVGNPFSAIAAKDIITPYTDANYPNNDNAALGNFEFTEIYYDYKTDAYCVDANSTKYPTEPSPISVNGEFLYDSFYHLMEGKISTPYVSDLSAVLRESLPDASFRVEFDGFVSLPDQAVLSSESGALYRNVRYDIFIGGIQSASDMSKAVTEMVNAIDRSGIGYAQLTFKSGIGLWMRRSVTVTQAHLKGHFVPNVDFVPVINTNEFSEYIRSAILNK